MITVTDLFCGAGGSGLGATAVPGVQLMMAANHSPRAIETHAANFPNCAHDCADISQVEPRRYRRTNILWASPECTNHSQAKGKKRRTDEQSLFDEPVPDHVAERSRATMWDVPRFAEVHRYDAVIVENVVDAALWPPFHAWLAAMDSYGYDHHIVFLNSMHAPAIAAPRAPQSRDRMYVLFWRRGNPAPDLEVRPRGWCEQCGEVEARQAFKARGTTWPLARWGRYRAQYVYVCSTSGCGRPVEPYALPAAAAIDWSTPGQRIGDRDRPLSDKTVARIRAGLDRYARPLTFEATGNTYVRPGSGYARAWPVDWPTATLTTSHTRALLVPAGGTRNESATSVTDPFRTRTTTENEALLVPVEGRNIGPLPASAPMRTQTTRHETALVVPYYGNGRARPAAPDPMPTMTTVDTAAVVEHGTVTVEDCTFRMLTVGEIQSAMAFTPDYIITGTKREQVKQLGNGVTPPAAEFLIRAVVRSLGGDA